MNVGRLDRRIRIERPTTAQDLFGEPVPTWGVLDTVWAQVEPLKGSERFVAQQASAEVDTRFTVRWRDDIDATMRIVYEDAVYDIDSVIEIGRHEGLEIMAKSRVLEEA